MRVATNSVSENIISQLQKLSTKQAQLQSQVATGQRITQPADDPAAIGRVLKLQSQQRQTAQYTRNADRALQLSQASYAGLQAIKKISDRVTEIGTLTNGMQSDAAMQAYASELDQLIEQGVQAANSNLSNEYLFGGTAVDAPPFAATRDANGQITSVAYHGNTDQAAIPLSDTAAVTPGTSGDTNTGLRDMLNSMIALRDAITSGNTGAISSIQSDLLGSEDKLVAALAEHGGVQTRIEVMQSEQTTQSENTDSLISSEANADMATTIVRLNEIQTAYQAALQSSSYIMRLSLLDYIQ